MTHTHTHAGRCTAECRCHRYWVCHHIMRQSWCRGVYLCVCVLSFHYITTLWPIPTSSPAAHKGCSDKSIEMCLSLALDTASKVKTCLFSRGIQPKAHGHTWYTSSKGLVYIQPETSLDIDTWSYSEITCSVSLTLLHRSTVKEMLIPALTPPPVVFTRRKNKCAIIIKSWRVCVSLLSSTTWASLASMLAPVSVTYYSSFNRPLTESILSLVNSLSVLTSFHESFKGQKHSKTAAVYALINLTVGTSTWWDNNDGGVLLCLNLILLRFTHGYP